MILQKHRSFTSDIFDVFLNRRLLMRHYEVKSTVWSNPRLWAVSLGETLAWAGLFYLFPASLIRWKLHFDWSISELSGGLMIALIVSAITGIGSGKLIDKGLGRELMSGSVRRSFPFVYAYG